MITSSVLLAAYIVLTPSPSPELSTAPMLYSELLHAEGEVAVPAWSKIDGKANDAHTSTIRLSQKSKKKLKKKNRQKKGKKAVEEEAEEKAEEETVEEEKPAVKEKPVVTKKKAPPPPAEEPEEEVGIIGQYFPFSLADTNLAPDFLVDVLILAAVHYAAGCGVQICCGIPGNFITPLGCVNTVFQYANFFYLFPVSVVNAYDRSVQKGIKDGTITPPSGPAAKPEVPPALPEPEPVIEEEPTEEETTEEEAAKDEEPAEPEMKKGKKKIKKRGKKGKKGAFAPAPLTGPAWADGSSTQQPFAF